MEQGEEPVSSIVQNLENSLSHKYDRLHQIMMRRIDTLDTLTRDLYKTQSDQGSKMNKVAETIKKSDHTLNEIHRQLQEMQK